MAIRGWLFPNGEFLECALYEHIATIRNNEYIKSNVPEVEKIFTYLKDIEEDCERIAKAEGSSHAEWHIYEIACDRAPSRIRKLLLDNGFIRVGEADNSIHFEGRPNILKNKHQLCKDFADSYAATAIFEPQR